MGLFLGLDLSLTGSGVSVINVNGEILWSKKLSCKVTGVERLRLLEMDLMSMLDMYSSQIQLAAIESPAYGVKDGGGRLFELGEWAGITKLNLHKLGIKFIMVAPTQLKKYILGKSDSKSSSTKDLIMLDIYKKWGIEIRDNNIADSYVLARIARDYSHDPDGLESSQKEVLAKLKQSQKVIEAECVLV